MEADFPDNGNVFSNEGTARHEVCALGLTTGARAADHVGAVMPNGVVYRAEWVDEDQDYINTVRTLADGGELFVERVVNFEAYTGVSGDSFGTADAIILRPISGMFELIVIDRKTGYHEVEVERNKQLMLYALGALAEFGLAYDIARVRLVVHQRTAREWDCSIDELFEFAYLARQKAVSVQKAVQAHGNVPAGEWQRIYLNQDPSEDACRYCKAMAVCPSMQAKVQSVVGADFATVESVPQVATDGEALLSKQMAAVGLVEDWCKAVRAEVERRLLVGGQVPGFGLELGKKGDRKWSDETAAETMLRKTFRLPVEKAYSMKVISPTQAEKLVKAGDIGERQWKKAETLITRADPKPSVKPISVIKTPYTPPNAADDFAPIQQEAGAELC
jgi:hypothetical protein